jgi:DNA end-binding protein Ku
VPATVWKGYLSFGLVSFPVRLFAAARREPVQFHMLHSKDLSRIKEVWYCAAEDKPVNREDIVKGYEVAKDEYVVVEESEIKNVAPPSDTTMEILQFVRANEMDPLYLDKSYYVRPDEKQSKPYALFLAAVKESKYYAIAKLAMHDREHIVVIRPSDAGLVLHTLYYPDELHQAAESDGIKQSKLNPKELDLAKKLIETLAGPFKPEEYHDCYRENLEHLIEQKQNGKKVSPVKRPKAAHVVDILDALQRSLHRPSKVRPAKSPKKQGRTAA